MIVKKEKKKAVVPKLRFPEFRESEGWDLKHGDELFDAINNRSPSEALPILAITQEHGAIPRDQIDYHVSVTAQSIESYKVVEKGDFIISLRSFQGGIEYSSYRGICSPAYVVLRRKGEGSDGYFRHLFKSARFIQQLTRNIEGLRDGKMISYKQFSEQRISVPAPTEQQKVADCLTSLDELIAAQGRKVEALKTYKRGLMQQLFPREGETLPRLRFPEFRDAPEWKEVPLGDLFDTSSGGTPDRTKREYWTGTIPWVTTSLVDFNVITKVDESISEAGLENSSAKVFPGGTVLIAMYGQGKTRGKVAMLGIPAATNQACAAILPNDDVDNGFTFVSLCGRYEEMRKLSNSGGQENLSQALIRALPFRYPKDVDEQSKIVECFSEIDALIIGEDEKLDTLKIHKEGLMQQLFPNLEYTK